MKREGSLAERDFSRPLLLSLYEEGWSGQVTLTSAGVGKTITVQTGKMVFASSSSTDDRLGEQLLRRGRISLQQFFDGSSAMSPGKRLGTVLVEQGALTPKDLVAGVVDQTRDIIYSLFLWTEGHYRWGPPSAGNQLNLRLLTQSWASGASRPGPHRPLSGKTPPGRTWASSRRSPANPGPDVRASWRRSRAAHRGRICAASTLADFGSAGPSGPSVVGILRRTDMPRGVATVALEDDGLGDVLSAGD